MKSPENPIDCFFVYGTLCRGQCRENLWPVEPKTITPAWVFGELYGRSDYPAMRPGTDRIAGECWQFEPEEIAEVLQVLDIIEGTNQPGVENLYDRVVVEAFMLNGLAESFLAYGYHYSIHPRDHGFERIEPVESGMAHWPSA